MPLSLAAIIETLSCDVQQVLAALQKIIGQHFDLLQKFEAADVYFCLYGTTLDIKLSPLVFLLDVDGVDRCGHLLVTGHTSPLPHSGSD